MKSIAAPLMAVALATTLAACTPPDETPPPAAQPAPVAEAPAAQAPAAETPAPAAPAVPALRALEETERTEALVAVKGCNLESADGAPFAGADITLATPAAVKVTGWIKPDRADAAIEQPKLRIEAADKMRLWDIPVEAKIAREDLSPGAADAGTPGFEAVFDASALPAGRYHLYLVYRAGGALAGCDNGRHVAIL